MCARATQSALDGLLRRLFGVVCVMGTVPVITIQGLSRHPFLLAVDLILFSVGEIGREKGARLVLGCESLPCITSFFDGAGFGNVLGWVNAGCEVVRDTCNHVV